MRNCSDRRRKSSALNSSAPVRATSIVDTAAIVGSISKRIPSHMRRGNVTAVVPETNSATISSSKEVTNANRAPASTPGRMSGNVTWRKALNGLAPRLTAADSIRSSKP